MPTFMRLLVALLAFAACSPEPRPATPVTARREVTAFNATSIPAMQASPAQPTFAGTQAGRAQSARASCGGAPMRIHAYDVGQALAMLVELPDGQTILVDTANSSTCGPWCAEAHSHLMAMLAADLHGRPIDLLWITHQHADHLGGAVDVLENFVVRHYVDNRRDSQKPKIKEIRAEATEQGAEISYVEPGHTEVPFADTEEVHLTAIVPSRWPSSCLADSPDRNACSILLRIDYCESSVLFTGDAERYEEVLLEPGGPVTLLQVGHHGSNTSSTAAFLAKVQPRYAVISAGHPGEGENATYCHPRASTVAALTEALGGPGDRTLTSFDGEVKCTSTTPASKHWIKVPASDRLWATERDGDVVLTTTGDGEFTRE